MVRLLKSTRVVKGWPRTLQYGYNEHVSCRDLLASSCLIGVPLVFRQPPEVSMMKQGRQAAPDLGSNATQPLLLHIPLRFTSAFPGVASMQRCAFQLQ